MITDKQKFNQHKHRAEQRGIPFLLSFQEWYDIWIASGYWNERGVYKGQYCMSRIGDTGPYSVDNVYINTNAENIKDAWLGKKRGPASKEHKIKNAKAQIGKKQSPETIAKKVAAYKATLANKNIRLQA